MDGDWPTATNAMAGHLRSLTGERAQPKSPTTATWAPETRAQAGCQKIICKIIDLEKKGLPTPNFPFLCTFTLSHSLPLAAVVCVEHIIARICKIRVDDDDDSKPVAVVELPNLSRVLALCQGPCAILSLPHACFCLLRERKELSCPALPRSFRHSSTQQLVG
jgi:hypothetical protein